MYERVREYLCIVRVKKVKSFSAPLHVQRFTLKSNSNSTSTFEVMSSVLSARAEGVRGLAPEEQSSRGRGRPRRLAAEVRAGSPGPASQAAGSAVGAEKAASQAVASQAAGAEKAAEKAAARAEKAAEKAAAREAARAEKAAEKAAAREAARAEKAAEKEAARDAARAEKEAARDAARAEKEAARDAARAEKEAAKAAARAEKEAAKAAARDAARAQKEAAKAEKAAARDAAKAEKTHKTHKTHKTQKTATDEELQHEPYADAGAEQAQELVPEEVRPFEHEGVCWLRGQDDALYDPVSHRRVAAWDREAQAVAL